MFIYFILLSIQLPSPKPTDKFDNDEWYKHWLNDARCKKRMYKSNENLAFPIFLGKFVKKFTCGVAADNKASLVVTELF